MSTPSERRFGAGKGRDWEAYGNPQVEEQNRNGVKLSMQYLERCLEQNQRTYNSFQLSKQLDQERQVSLSADRKRLLLQKRGTDGSGLATPTGVNKIQCKKESFRQTWKP